MTVTLEFWGGPADGKTVAVYDDGATKVGYEVCIPSPEAPRARFAPMAVAASSGPTVTVRSYVTSLRKMKNGHVQPLLRYVGVK